MPRPNAPGFIIFNEGTFENVYPSFAAAEAELYRFPNPVSLVIVEGTQYFLEED